MFCVGFDSPIGGYQDQGQESPSDGWHWITGEPFEYTNWRDGQPDDWRDGEEAGVELVVAKSKAFKDTLSIIKEAEKDCR